MYKENSRKNSWNNSIIVKIRQNCALCYFFPAVQFCLRWCCRTNSASSHCWSLGTKGLKEKLTLCYRCHESFIKLSQKRWSAQCSHNSQGQHSPSRKCVIEAGGCSESVVLIEIGCNNILHQVTIWLLWQFQCQVNIEKWRSISFLCS